MARVYEWRNPATGEAVETDSYDVPPHEGWVRVYSLGFGAVSGAANSPSRFVRGK